MKAPSRSTLLLAPLLAASCNGSCQGQQIVTNAMPLEVSDAFGGTTANVLYTTVTICDANSNCQTINNIQVDTGSGGLRIFKQALTVGLTPVMNGAAPVGVCQSFAMGQAWGPVQTASVKLASEPVITIPVQVIDDTFGPVPTSSSSCGAGDWTMPMDIHANGILGIDVGAPDSGEYFACQTNPCTTLTPSAAQRVTNPVLALPADNNGVIINLPTIPDDGQATASGNLTLGIGTTWNNDPKTFSTNPIVKVLLNPSDPTDARTTGNSNLPYFLFAADTGSNAFYFTDPTITRCPSIFNTILTTGWYCPGTVPGSNPPIIGKNFPVTVTGFNGTPDWHFQVWIRDKTTLVATGNLAFNDLGFNLGTNSDLFIAGLPFFFGKQVYFGYATKSSPLGSGPLYGYALR